MLKNRVSSSIVVLIALFCSCIQIQAPSEVRQVLDQAGSNKSELEEVIRHYSKYPADSLKLKAAYFLISNMDGWYYYEGELLDRYQDYTKLISRDKHHGAYYLHSFNELYGKFSSDRLKVRFDIREVKSGQLINNIDASFKVWHEQPWGKDISFDMFCKYILPYRIKDEIPEYNRLDIYRQFNGILDSVREAGGDAVAACIAINKELKKTPYTHTIKATFLPHFPASKLIKYPGTGACRERTNLAVYVMRAVGIPVTIDFIHQWPWRSMGHEYNAVIDKNGESVIFLGCEDHPGEPHSPGRKRGKIYRRMYAKDPASLAMQKEKDTVIPEFFRETRIKDVTDEYVSTFNIRISLDNNPLSKKIAYLNVYNDQNWIPVHWAKSEKDGTLFTKMEGGVVYLPSYFDEAGPIPAYHPFVLSDNGQVNYLKADKNRLHKQMVLSDNYNPVFPANFRVDYMLGARFQGANRADFSDAVDLHRIIARPIPSMNEIDIDTSKQFRYFRYLSPSNQYCRIGELEFYSSGVKLSGNIIGTETSRNNDDKITLDKAMDGDLMSYFWAKAPSGAWVGLDIKKPVKVDKVKFSAAFIGPPTKIVPEHEYELFYWDNDQWISAGIKTATDSKLIFNNIPSNALYTLHDHTKKLRERIFTYENDKQIWW